VLEIIWLDCDLLCALGLECVDENEWRGVEKERLLMLLWEKKESVRWERSSYY
jgi:hypothetical protein